MKKIIVIAGPTAVGKTALSIQLAHRFCGEIISGDSMQIYRKLDIGTAKVTEAEKEGIVHHLIDICELNEPYTVADFQRQARQKIEEISQRGKLPIVVGGTGLYLQSLLYDYRFGTTDETDHSVRQKYENYAENYGKAALYALLKEKDPLAADKIHMNNQRRVIRALEVMETSGHSILAPEEIPDRLYDAFLIGLKCDRQLLYQRINQRVDQMLAAGLIKEAELIRDYPDVQAAHGIGYKEFLPYFTDQQSLEETADLIKRNSRHYAKRQFTWFFNRMRFDWYDLLADPKAQGQITNKLRQWLEVSDER